MGIFKELDPELHLKLVEGYEDVLTPAAHAQEAFYQAHRKCKRCGDAMRKEFDSRVMWSAEEPLPRALLKCDKCGFMLDPHSGIVVNAGSAAHIPQPIIPAWKIDH